MSFFSWLKRSDDADLNLIIHQLVKENYMLHVALEDCANKLYRHTGDFKDNSDYFINKVKERYSTDE